MELKLSKDEMFWALINPADVNDVTLVLNQREPVQTVDEAKLPLWAKKQIVSSHKKGTIKSVPELVLADKKAKTTKKKAKSKN